GLKGLFLVRVESFSDEYGDPRSIGFDSSLEFQPRWSLLSNARIGRRKWWHRRKLRTAEPGICNNYVCSYEDLVEKSLTAPTPPYSWIPCVCPGWDNSPRRNLGASILINSRPENYERWLRNVVSRQRRRIQLGEKPGISVDSLVFINA